VNFFILIGHPLVKADGFFLKFLFFAYIYKCIFAPWQYGQWASEWKAYNYIIELSINHESPACESRRFFEKE